MSSKGRNKKNSEEQPSTLDLGLSALLSGDSPGDSPSVHADPRSSETTTPLGRAAGELPVDPPVTRTLSEFEELFERKDWGALVKLAEAKLVLTDDPEFRLWWVRGHLGAFSMPVSFLAAPLEAVCRRARDHQLNEELRPVLEETGALALARLKEVGARDQVESLQDSLLDAGILDVGRRERPIPAKVQSPPQAFSGTNADSSTQHEATPRTPREKLARSSIKVSWVGLVAGLTVLLSVGIGGWYWFHTVLSVPVVIAEEDFISEPLTVDQLIPPLERRGAVGSLSALFYSIEHPEQPTAAPQQSGPNTVANDTAPKGDQGSPNQGASSATATSTVPRKPDPLPTAGRRKERIDTRAPVEGPDLKERLRNRETRSPRDSSREPALRGPEARMSPPVMENRNPDLFDPGGVYRVLVRTSVLANPSYAAEVVGRLEPGDRVFVEAKLGRWVRLRSKRGRGGFVLAEDVAEVSPDSMRR